MNTPLLLPFWVQIIIAILLLVSAVFAVLSALGLVRFNDFYMRMHPTAIVTTVGMWCTCIAVAIYFTYLEESIAWYLFLLMLLMIITAPITTAMLARAVLFRWRNEAHAAPPALSYTVVYSNLKPVKSKTELEEDAKSESPAENDLALKNADSENSTERL